MASREDRRYAVYMGRKGYSSWLRWFFMTHEEFILRKIFRTTYEEWSEDRRIRS